MTSVFKAMVAGAAGLLVTGAAQAAVFAFDVSVDSRVGLAGSFAPFTYQEAWEIASAPKTSSLAGTPDHSYYRQYGFGPASGGTSSLSSDLRALVELDAADTYSYYAIKSFDFYADAPATASYQFDVYDMVSSSTDLGDGTFLEKTYLREIKGTGALASFDEGVLDDAGLYGLLAQAGPFNWTEWGLESVYDPEKNSYRTIHQVSYFGTATFTEAMSPAPEPASWALMFVGFGILGASIRWRGAPKSRIA